MPNDEAGISFQQTLDLAIPFRDVEAPVIASHDARSKTMIAVTGNCQSMFLSSVLNSLPNIEAQYFGKQGRFIPFEGVSAVAHPQTSLIEHLRQWKDAGYRVLLCEQVWPIAEPVDADSLDGIVDGLVRFPNFEAYALWPERKYNPAQCARLSVARTLRFDRASITASEKKATLSFVDIFDDCFKDTLLFDTERHPSPAFFSKIVRRLLQAPIFSELNIDIDGLEKRVRASRAINSVVSHPVDNRIVDELECAWAQTPVYLKWRAICESIPAAKPSNTAALIEELFPLRETDPEFFDLIAPAIWTKYASMLLKMRDREGSDNARRKAIAADPYNVAWRTIFYSTLRRQKRYAEAREIIIDYMNLAPEHAACQEMLGNLAMDEGDFASARKYFNAAVVTSPRLVASSGNLAAMNMDVALTYLKGALDDIQRSKYAAGKFGANRIALREAIAQLSKVADTMRS